MGVKINQYPLERLVFGDDDYYDIDYWNGTSFESAKILGSTIKAAIVAGMVDTNFFTGNYTATQNIEQETDQYNWIMKKSNQGPSQLNVSYGFNGNEFQILSNSATDYFEQKIRELYSQTRIYNNAGAFLTETNLNQSANSIALNGVNNNDTSQMVLSPSQIYIAHNDATITNSITINDTKAEHLFDAGINRSALSLEGLKSILTFYNTINGQFSEFQGNGSEIMMRFDDGNGEGANFQLSGTDHYFSDAVTNPKGLQYGGNYHSTYVLRSLVDKEYVDLAIAGVTGANLFTANLNLLTNRVHTLNDKSIQFDLANATGNSGNWKITNSSIGGYLYDTSSGGLNYTTVNQQADSIILTAESSTSTSPHVLGINGNAILASVSNYGFTLDEQFNLSQFYGENGVIQIGSTTINTNTFYKDNTTNKYGILYKDFGETSETDATGANYSTLVGTSLVPKKYVDDKVADITNTKTLTLENPVNGDNISIFRTPYNLKIVEVASISFGTTPSTTFTMKFDSNRSATGTTIVNATTTTSVTTGDNATLTTPSGVSVPADSFIWIEVTGSSATNFILSIDIKYTEN